MTTLTGSIHRDQWQKFVETALLQLTEPGWRQEDFERVRTRQLNALTQDLRSNNEEELGRNGFRRSSSVARPYGHVSLGTVAGVKAITLDDVKRFAQTMFTRANLTLGVSGDVRDEMLADLRTRLAALPAGTPAPRVSVQGRAPSGIEVDIIKKDTRATAVSFGFPIDVTRKHPDFVALSVARAWLGDHRNSTGAAVSAHSRGAWLQLRGLCVHRSVPARHVSVLSRPEHRAQPADLRDLASTARAGERAHGAAHRDPRARRAGEERSQQRRVRETRDYLLKNVFVMTARQDQQLGYALDSRWYGIPEFTSYMREGLQKLTLDQVNSAIKQHLQARNLSVVMITDDAEGLKKALVSDAFSPVKYDGQKPKALLDEDKAIGAMKLNIAAANITITPVEEVFAN
jgi:zinc protease